jgi:hypothetical protein
VYFVDPRNFGMWALRNARNVGSVAGSFRLGSDGGVKINFISQYEATLNVRKTRANCCFSVGNSENDLYILRN